MKAKRIDWNPFGVTYETGDDEDNPGLNRIVIYAFRWRVEWRLPEFVKPSRVWVDTSRHSWSSESGGYWDVNPREWGFRVCDGSLQVFLGPQTNDSATTKSWSKFLPWTQWRHVRISYFDPAGEHLRTYFDTTDREVRRAQSDSRYEFEKEMPKAIFVFRDYDGEVIEATTHIEEREWRFGEGWFKWLSLFRRPKIRRSLSIEFNKEVGPRKGSWKGGTIGHGTDMMPGETPVQAFARYCLAHKLTLLSQQADA